MSHTERKAEALTKLGEAIDLATAQIESGQYSEFTAQELPDLAEAVKAEGRKRREMRDQSKT